MKQGNGRVWIVGAGPADPDSTVVGGAVRPAAGIRGELAHPVGEAR
jgi:hypothetical protein